MRIGLGRRRTPQFRAAGWALVAVGAIIIFLAMPVLFYVALGGLIAYLGYLVGSR